MKKILYITVDNFSENNSGIVKKIKSQQKAFLKLGFQCDLLYSQDNNIYINNNFIKKSYNKYYRRLFFFYNLYKYIKLSSYNSLYIRYPGSNIFFIKFLKKIKERNMKVVIEIPTYPYDNESKGFLMKMFNFIDKIYREQLYKYIDRVVTFSNDNEIFGIKTIKINNGIDVLQVPIINEEKNYNIDNEINFISVAQIAIWHGLDRFILSMSEYYKNNPKEIIKFHVVGDGQKDVVENLKRLVRDNNLEKFVIFYGYKSGKGLDEIYNKSDIGVGCLGNFRKGILSGGALKNQEYCAKGLPFIIAGYDDNYKDVDFMYKVAADESLINLNEIINWYKNLKVRPEQIRKYIEDNLTWDKQMKKVVDYILKTEEKEKC